MVDDLCNGGRTAVKSLNCGNCGGTFGPLMTGSSKVLQVLKSAKSNPTDNVEIESLEHKHGNDMADKYAGAAVIEVTSGDEARVRRLVRKTRLIQEPMIQAISMLPKRARHPHETAAEPSTDRAPRIAAAKRCSMR